jgi:hypothetical protein
LSAREQSQVLTVLNRPQESRSLAMLSTDIWNFIKNEI